VIAPGVTLPFNDMVGTERSVDFRLRLTQKVLDLPAMGRWKASQAEANAANEGAIAVSETAAEHGALTYLKVLRAEASLAARMADSTLAQELLDMARDQQEAGTAIGLDVTRAQSQLASAVSQLIRVRAERDRAELDLIHALALPVDSDVQLADSLRAPLEEDFITTEADAVRTALNQRGDVLSATASVEAAVRRIKATQAERLPTVAFFATATSTPDGMYENRRYGLAISVPLFDGLRRESRIAEGRAREREATAHLADARLRAEVDVRTAMVELRATRDRVAAARVQLTLAEEEVAQARERFAAGLAGNADVITSSMTLNSARDVVVDALTAYHTARVTLASAQGRTRDL
jgi:outer membrane protein TolC